MPKFKPVKKIKALFDLPSQFKMGQVFEVLEEFKKHYVININGKKIKVPKNYFDELKGLELYDQGFN